MSKEVGLVGYGWVGKSMAELFPNSIIHDPYSEEMPYDRIASRDQINDCDVAFISVPTPNCADKPCNGEGMLNTTIVEDCVSWVESPLIVIRSTVNPGDTDKWAKKYDKHIVMQPEYLGETPSHPMLDPKTRRFLVIGGEPEDRRKLIEIYTEVYNANTSIRQVSALEAEVIKLSENRAIAFKVAQCQELYDVCEKSGVDYYTIREAVYGDDPRFDLWFSFIFPDARGMNSKCIPKDVYAWSAWAESVGYKPQVTRALLEKNKEWLNDRV
jgi:UDPglucose 6-dehydrogenase